MTRQIKSINCGVRQMARLSRPHEMIAARSMHKQHRRAFRINVTTIRTVIDRAITKDQ